MRVLIISDTHDNLIAIKNVIEIVNSQNIDLIIHLGDYVSPFSLKLILDANKPLVGIFGNNDGDKSKLLELFPSLTDQPLEVDIDQYNALLFHGFKSKDITRKVVYAIAKEGIYDLILYGHTHDPDLTYVNKTLIINPGALSGYLTDRKTYAIIDTDAKKVEVIDLESSEVIKECKIKR